LISTPSSKRADDRAERAVEPAEHGAREGVEQHRLHQVLVEAGERGRGQHPRDRAHRGGRPPPEREQPADADADEPCRVGSTAAAREARPSFVKRKKAQSSATAPSETAIVPRSWIENATPATSIGPRREGVRQAPHLGDQIQRAAPLTRKKSPSVTITTVSTGARSTGLITTRSIATPAKNEIATVARKAAQYVKAVVDERPRDEGREHRHLALGEVDDAGRAVDQHERTASVAQTPPEARPITTCCASCVQSKVSSISSRGTSVDRFVALQGGAVALDRDLAHLEHVRAGRRLERKRGVLLDHEHGQALALVQLPTIRKISATTIGASPSEGSSSSSRRGRSISARGDREHLLLAAAERSRRAGRGRSRSGGK
jgi:hypothetical protein